MTRKSVSEVVKRTFYAVVVAIGLAGTGVAFSPEAALADDWHIDCFAPYDGCCACSAGTISMERGGGGQTNAGGDGSAYSCTSGAPKGRGLCESNGSEGRCGESKCGKDDGGEV